jgi:hypothetical protein
MDWPGANHKFLIEEAIRCQSGIQKSLKKSLSLEAS